MLAAAALSGPLPKVGVIAVALLAAVMLCVGGRRRSRLRAAAMLGALVLAPVLLLADIWHSSELHIVHRHPLVAVAIGLLALAGLGLVARQLPRYPPAFALLTTLALPFRIPITLGGTTSNLLVPLYLVVGAGALAWIVPELRGRERGLHYRSRREEAAALAALRAAPRPVSAELWIEPRLVTWLARLLALSVVLYAVQSVYSDDFTAALQNVVFFYVPFALMFELLRLTRWPPGLLRACLAIAGLVAIALSLIGFYEYATKTIILNHKLEVTNDLHAYFTINSLFYDPDIFGRFLALVMVLLAATLLHPRRPREILAVTGTLAICWACLILTLSRSSLAALLLGLAALAALRWRATRALYVVAAVVAAGAIAVAITPTTFGLNQGFNGVSSGRGGLLAGGARLFGDRPLQGFGSGSFVHQYRAHNRGTATSLSASHTIPVTIGAEQGLIGLFPYIALVLCALTLLVRGARGDPVRTAIAATFAALMLHTLLYADFLEDPTTWALLGIGAALAPLSHRRPPAADAAAGPASAGSALPAV